MFLAGPHRRHDEDGQAFEPLHQIGEVAQGAAVAPLQVVDGHHEGAGRGQVDHHPVQAVQHGEGAVGPLGRVDLLEHATGAGRGAGEGDRPAVRLGEFRFQQLPGRTEAERALELAPTGRQHRAGRRSRRGSAPRRAAGSCRCRPAPRSAGGRAGRRRPPRSPVARRRVPDRARRGRHPLDGEVGEYRSEPIEQPPGPTRGFAARGRRGWRTGPVPRSPGRAGPVRGRLRVPRPAWRGRGAAPRAHRTAAARGRGRAPAVATAARAAAPRPPTSPARARGSPTRRWPVGPRAAVRGRGRAARPGAPARPRPTAHRGGRRRPGRARAAAQSGADRVPARRGQDADSRSNRSNRQASTASGASRTA